jgi:hypothetical protein
MYEQIYSPGKKYSCWPVVYKRQGVKIILADCRVTFCTEYVRTLQRQKSNG